jgi:hypothetical protein
MRCDAIISCVAKAGILGLDRFAHCRVASNLARIGRAMARLAGGKNSTTDCSDLDAFHDWLFVAPEVVRCQKDCAPESSRNVRRGPREQRDTKREVQ